MRKKSELIKELDELKAEKLQREREDCRPFRLFSGTKEGIYITEGEGKAVKTIRRYDFGGYNFNRDVVFRLVDEYVVK